MLRTDSEIVAGFARSSSLWIMAHPMALVLRRMLRPFMLAASKDNHEIQLISVDVRWLLLVVFVGSLAMLSASPHGRCSC